MLEKSFYVKTLGCKVNQVESAYIIESLTKEGFSLSSEDKAKILILNSCMVTAKAEAETGKVIRKWSKLNPQIIVITGCYAQKFYKELSQKFTCDKIRFVILGQKEKFKIAEILNKILEEDQAKKDLIIQVENIFQEKSCFPIILHNFLDHARAFIKVQDGCNNFCSYCIVPYVRGPERSVPMDKILEQIKIFMEKGYQEIVLTGINLGKWGKDFSPPKKISDLLWQIEEFLKLKKKDFNLRLSSIEINEIDEDFLEFAKKSQFLVPHFHISLQSASNKILKLMNRKGTKEDYLRILLKLYEIYPYATFGADIIVGFPGEEEEDFKETYKFIKDSPINWLHIFPFSPRPGTIAEKLPHRVKPQIIKERSEILKKLFLEKRKKFLEKEIGKTRKVVLERFDEKLKMWKGLSENYISTLVSLKDKKEELKGKIVRVKFLKLEDNYMVGDLVESFQNKKA